MPMQHKAFFELIQAAQDAIADMKALPMIRHHVRPNEDEPDLQLMEHFQARGSTAQEALKLMQRR